MSDFAHRLIAWQQTAGRHDLPWQASRDPYRVWLSEIMLQQTQVATVIPYYGRFLDRFPTLAALAEAPVEEVMAHWSGLGYYARARNLHACAREIMARHGGRFPVDAAAIARLPGIGRSTAHAIAVFCFDARLPILDGNVKRLLCRHQGVEGFPGTPAVERRLWQLAEALLPQRQVDAYIQAQMDLGATLCARSRPGCAACPVAADCIARRDGRTGQLPAARPRRPRPEKQMRLLVLRHGERVLLQPRPPTGIWGGLLSLPEAPVDGDLAAQVAALGCRLVSAQALAPVNHGFTHFRLRLEPWLCAVAPQERTAEGADRWLTPGEWRQAGLPAPVRRLLAHLPAVEPA